MDEPTTDRDALYVEKTIRLPHSCFGCFDPHGEATSINPLPALKDGFVTFASLNNFAKVTELTIELWTSLLHAAPTARLLLRAPQGSARARLLDRLRSSGIDPSRIGFVGRVPRSQYFSLYHQIDIFLDTFPYTGHTTTIDAIWMGVPVVTLAGQTAVSRGSLSILNEIGAPDLVATNTDQYVQVAANLAQDLSRLQNLRSSLRDRLRHSVLMDAARFAANLEAVYRQIWKAW
jgi:predicted O-linked N-acetylglucosamine transferase (SPINDLY family)